MENLKTKIYESIGHASTCWKEAPNSEFDEKEANKVAENLLAFVDPKIPKGWVVFEAGQSPLHMLWFVNLVSFDDLAAKVEKPRRIFVKEKNNFLDALNEAINLIS